MGAAALVLAIAGAALSSLGDKDEQRLPDRLDPHLVVVAPFAVYERELELWREGMANVLARNLDGAGPLRTVSPRVAVRRWRGFPDRESAAELGRATGARIVLLGRLIRAGQDSVRASATLVDAATGRVLGEVERREEVTRMDRLTDSLTVSILRDLGERRPIGDVRRSAVGSATSRLALETWRPPDRYRLCQASTN